MFQNPIEQIIILSSNLEITRIEIYNNLGQKILSVNSSTAITEIPVNTIPAGIYFLKAKDRLNNIYTERIQIKGL